MEKFEKKIKDPVSTLVAFLKVGHQNAVDVKFVADNVKHALKDKLSIVLIDGSFNEPMLKKYKVAHFPSWILFNSGKEVWRAEGMKNSAEIEEAIKSLV